MQPNGLALVAFISGNLNLFVGIQVYRQNTVAFAKSFLYAMLGLTAYIWGYAAELTATNVQQASFWLPIEYLGLNITLLFLLKFVMDLCAFNTRTYQIGLVSIWLIGVSHFVLLLTNPLHGWHYRELKMVWQWGAWLIQVTPGWAYWAYVVYLQGTLLLTGVLFCWRVPHFSRIQRKQRMVFCVIIAVALVLHLLRLIFLARLPLDLTALTLGFFTINALWLAPDSEILNLIHLAGRHLLQNLKEPVILLDDDKTLLDANPAACALFQWDAPPLGAALHQWLHIAPETLATLENFQIASFTTPIQQREWQITFSPIFFQTHQCAGYLLLLHDVSAHLELQRFEQEQRIFAEQLSRLNLHLNGLSTEAALDAILPNLEDLLPYHTADLLLIEDGMAKIVRRAGNRSLDDDPALKQFWLDIQQTANLRQMLETHTAYLISDVRRDPNWIHLPEAAWIGSHLGAPLYIQEQILGFVHLNHAQPNFYQQHHALRLQMFATQVAHALMQARAFEQVQQARQQAEQTERDLRALFAAMTDVVIVYDREGHYRKVAPTNPSRLLRPPEELIGKSLFDVPPFELASQFIELIRQALTTQQVITHEYELPVLSGTRWFSTTISPADDTQVFWVARDITELKQKQFEIIAANNQLHQQLDEIGQLQTRLREQAIRDPLTGAFNRRYMNEIFESLLRQYNARNPLSVIMFDIDHFKDVNDIFGHKAGDCVLKTLIETIQNLIRRDDILVRYGGEEFLAILPGMSLHNAQQRAEMWRTTVQSLTFVCDACAPIHITISLGIAAYPQHGTEPAVLLHAADTALYLAKNSGRNRVALPTAEQLPKNKLYQRDGYN